VAPMVDKPARTPQETPAIQETASEVLTRWRRAADHRRSHSPLVAAIVVGTHRRQNLNQTPAPENARSLWYIHPADTRQTRAYLGNPASILLRRFR
jgi:hypothetical protein